MEKRSEEGCEGDLREEGDGRGEMEIDKMVMEVDHMVLAHQ